MEDKEQKLNELDKKFKEASNKMEIEKEETEKKNNSSINIEKKRRPKKNKTSEKYVHNKFNSIRNGRKW